MASRRLYDGAQIELGILPIVALAPPPTTGLEVWLKVSGVWKLCEVWLKESGTWKLTTPFLKESGVWK
jgi:hypothetical protein